MSEKEKNIQELEKIAEKYKKRNKYINEWQKNKYYRLTVLIPIEEKEILNKTAINKGFKNTSDYIKFLIDQDNKNPEPGPAQEPGAADNSIFVFD